MARTGRRRLLDLLTGLTYLLSARSAHRGGALATTPPDGGEGGKGLDIGGQGIAAEEAQLHRADAAILGSFYHRVIYISLYYPKLSSARNVPYFARWLR